MQDGESLSDRQKKMNPLTVGEFKRIIKENGIPDDTPMYADYPNGWSGLYQLYQQQGGLFFLASDKNSDSGIGGNYDGEIDTLLWEADGLND